MGALNGYFLLCVICACVQMVVQATPNDHEPMVAFICNMPAMHRGVNEWISDPETTECWLDKKPILNYCQKMYPNHNITNVVEAAYLVTIPGWPSLNENTLHSHRVRPFRCIVDNFQSDALLVPQHCKFDHKHDQKVCKGFSHWEVEAGDACAKDGMHCESFGMLLNCGLGTFSGVEYVCCPNKTPTRVHPSPPELNNIVDDSASESEEDSDEDMSDDDEDDDVDDDENDDDIEDEDWDSDEDEDEDEDEEDDEDEDEEEEEKSVDDDRNLYELYLKGEDMPKELRNEHLKFVAARQYMHKLQEVKNTQLMKEWTAARDHVNEVRKNDPNNADNMNKEITDRFQRLYSAYEQEDVAEKQQIVALHQQHVQADLNQRKRNTMDKYMRALEKGDVLRIAKSLRNYIKAEEKDVMHTVNHYSHVKEADNTEAARIHPHVIQHLKLCQQRIEQALEMLERYPEIERKVRPGIEEFLKKFDDMAMRIRTVVLPDPAVSDEEEDDSDNDEDSDEDMSPAAADDNNVIQPQTMDHVMDHVSVGGELHDDLSDSFEESSEEEGREDEHDYERPRFRPAHQTHNKMHVSQGLQSAATSGAQLGTTFAIAIGSVAIFVVLIVAVVMLRRRSTNRTNVTHGYVEVDPAASPEERHVANMQMNGYENPTYRYFEVQTNK